MWLILLLFDLTLGLQCYTCSYTVDHNGNQVGVTDDDCYDLSNGDEYLVECFIGATVCGTELIADWMPQGEQVFNHGYKNTPIFSLSPISLGIL